MNPIESRPTPETFAAKYMPCNARPGWTQKQWVVDAEFAENLERQKAALREALELLTCYARDFAHSENAKAVIQICDEALSATKPNP